MSDNDQSNEVERVDGSNKILIEASDDDNLILYALPNSLSGNIQESENDLFWIPTRKSYPLNLNTEFSLRDLSEEGLYVPQVPKVFYQNVLEQRLSLEDNNKWFNCDGRLKMLKVSPSTYFRPIKSYFSTLQTEYKLPTNKEEIDNIRSSVYTTNILEINIINIKFEHHPLFSTEHIFERRLLSLYDSYKEKCLHKDSERTKKKLETLRKTRCQQETIYINEVKKLREILFKEAREYRNIIKLILQTWKIIKNIRDINEYSNTSVKLTIHKENCSFENENQIWEEDINDVISEIKIEKQHEYENELMIYKEKITKWKANKISTKPKKPCKNVHEEEIKAQVIKLFKQSFKPPGEPILKFSISYDNEISTCIVNENEMLRRKAVQMTKVYAKVTCDGVEVCKSKLISLNNTFSCYIDETFALQLCNVPSRICLELYEQSSSMTKRKISEVTLQIPHTAKLYSKEKLLEDTFEKDEYIHYSHEGVGSGQDVSKIVEEYSGACENINLYTCGSVRYYLNWLENKEGTCDIIHPFEKKIMLNKGSHVDVNMLSEWISNVELDPENPKNSNLFEYINDNGTSFSPTYTTQKYSGAKLQPLMFYNTLDIDSNLRFKVLELRNDNEQEFTAMKVTNNIREIQSLIPSTHKKRILEEPESQAPESDSEKTFQEQRIIGKNCLKKIYCKIFQQCKNVENNLEYEDVIDEKLISYFQNSLKILATNLLNWFVTQSNIKNTFKKANLIATEEQMTENAASANVIINIISALNIPQRTRSKIEENVYTFVEVTYQRILFRTAVMNGVNPKWNEQLVFHVQSSNADYQHPDSLNDFIVINLFEEYTDVITEIKSTNWLGYIRVQLPTIYYCGKIEGYFRVAPPTANIYEENIDKIQDSSSNSVNSNAIYVFLKIRIEPTKPKLAVSMVELPSGEPSHLWKYIVEWNEKYNAKFPHRKFSAFAIDANGKTLCLTRFIASLEPPKIIENDFNVTPEQLARYISLIPFTCTYKLYDHICLTIKQMLNFTLGSIVDHAIALTCYFLAINIDAKLLLGYGLLGGPTAYVFVRELKDNLPINIIYDVVTVMKYNVTDPYCPLWNVVAAVNDKNIWANIQGANEIILTRFDFMSRSDWQPLFNDQMVGPINSIQEKIVYISANDTKELEFQIEKKIRKAITKLRKTRTLWNYNISGLLKDILMKLEYNYFLGKTDINAYIQSIQATHSINGYIIDLPYTNLSEICDFIKYSKIYEVHSPEVEFVTAIHMQAYPNKIFVVWIFIGYVISK